MSPTLPSRAVSLFVLAACVMALATGFTAQYVFGLKPCILCLIQRVPFALAGALAAASLLGSVPDRLRRGLMLLAGLALVVNGGIAVYHVGVEQSWWLSACVPTESGPVAVTDLAALMSKPVEARCDEPAWQWHGITMAALNILFSGGLGVVTLALARRMAVRR